jgi:plasmid stabilization system protein ParE
VSSFALHPAALADLEEIWDFIAADNIAAADRVSAEIFNKLHTIAASPHIGHRRPDLTSRPLRFALVRNYLIAYAPETEPLSIIAIIHSRRSPRIMAAILSGREGRPPEGTQ